MYARRGLGAMPAPPTLGPSMSFNLTSDPIANQYILIGGAVLGLGMLLFGSGSIKLLGLAIAAPGAYVALKAGAL